MRKLPEDSTLYQALSAIFSTGMAVLIAEDTSPVQATVDQFVNVVMGGSGPVGTAGIGVTQTGADEIVRLIRTQYARYVSLGYSGSYQHFKRRFIDPVCPPGGPAIKILIHLKNEEVATEAMYSALLEPNPQDMVQ